MKDIIEGISKGPIGEGEEVKEGQCLSSFAAASNIQLPRLVGANGGLILSRQHPNLLLPGDKVTIPKPEPKTDEESDVDGQITFQVHRPKCLLSLRFTEFGQPRKNVPFQLLVWKGGASPEPLAKGKLDEDGKLTQNGMRAEWTKAKVILGDQKAPTAEYEILIGSLGPPTEPRGIQTRLWNLGYYHHDICDKFTDTAENALRRFMVKNGILDKCDDAVDEDKVKDGLVALVKAHGC